MMAESPTKSEAGKEVVTTPKHHDSDIEAADSGILFKSKPLARELKGRHMQMIALGMPFHQYP